MLERPNIHPGEILDEEFLKPAGIRPEILAAAIGVRLDRLLAILDGRDAISAEISLRLSAYFGTSDGFWLASQMAYDLERARRQPCLVRDRIIPLRSAA